MKKSLLLLSALLAPLAIAQTAPASAAESSASTLSEKLQPYIQCYNALSGRAYESRARYLSWSKETGPTGKERIIYGLYTIRDPAHCAANNEAAGKAEPRDAGLESAGDAYAKAVTELTPLLKEANDYYDQSNYKDDKMAKGKALHPKLMAAWAKFEAADKSLDAIITTLNDKVQLEELAAVEKAEGKQAHYYLMSTMIKAKALVHAEGNLSAEALPKITETLDAYEASVNAMDDYAASGKKNIGSMFTSKAKEFLTSAKGLMRRIRDKTPYEAGEKMLIQFGSGAWLVAESPRRLMRDYNELVEAYNRGSDI